MTKALVTGGAGFIGSNVTRLLVENNYNVVVLDNLTTGYKENIQELPNMRFVEGDIRNQDLLERLMEDVEVVFHLASTVGNIKSIEHPLEDAEVNVLGTLKLLGSARKLGIRKIVFSSSSAIFGEPQYLPIDEKHPVEPDSPYGVTKLASEKHCLCYSKLYDMDIVCLRYFNVYGKNQRYDPYGNVIPIWTNCLLTGKPLIIYGDGEQTRDFINVGDVARANIMAGAAGAVKGTFNIGCGNSITINELAEVFQNVYGKRIEIIKDPQRKGEVKHSKADVSLAQKTFRFTPVTGIEQGISTYIEWVKREFYSK